MNLEDAIELAVKAHRGQKDKAGLPYILHPLTVMLRMDSEAEMTAAVLHDVVEGSRYTLHDLEQAGYPRAVVEAVDFLTRRDGEPYEAYVERAKSNPIARRVKLADLEHNMDIRRMKEPDADDLEMLAKYRRAWAVLTDGD